MKAKDIVRQLKLNQVGPDEDIYFAADEEANLVYEDAELIVMVGEKRKHLTFVPASRPIDTLDL
jgi:hypothetical protein